MVQTIIVLAMHRVWNQSIINQPTDARGNEILALTEIIAVNSIKQLEGSEKFLALFIQQY